MIITGAQVTLCLNKIAIVGPKKELNLENLIQTTNRKNSYANRLTKIDDIVLSETFP